MRGVVATLALLIMIPNAVALLPEDTLPPQDFRYRFEGSDLILEWDAPPFADPDQYVLYGTRNGEDLAPQLISADDALKVNVGPLAEDSIYTFQVAAIRGGEESLPTMPITFIGGWDYPPCSWYGIYKDPIQPWVRPECLIP